MEKVFKSVIITILMTFCSSGLLCAQDTACKNWIKAVDSAAFSPRSCHQVISFKEKLWLIGGAKSSFQKGNRSHDVWNSDDALNWKLVADTCEFEGGTAVVFLEKIWIINARGKTIWNSTDGIHWQKVSSVKNAAEFGTRAMVFNNKIWLTGGVDVIDPYFPNGKVNPKARAVWKNDIWSSSDGIIWQKENTDNSFSIRSDHSMSIFDNKLWILCGQSGPNKSDVWNSTDGINWNFVTNAPFDARHCSEVLAFGNKIWVIGGFGYDLKAKVPVLMADVWNSTDGKNWYKVTDSSPFGNRMEHQAIVYNNKLWVIGGAQGVFPNQSPKNDVWFTDANNTSKE